MIKKSLVTKLCVGIISLGIVFFGWMYGYSGPINQNRLTYSTYLTDEHGELLHVLLADDERYRIRTRPQDVDPTFLDLLITYEDQRFYQHSGVDWLAMSRAFWQWLSHGYILSGGSTLTMQAVRLLEPKPRTLLNKLDQMRKAIALERSHTKDEVLSIYLSLAPFGSNVESVQMASLRWFGKWSLELTPAESALLVALPQSPERRRPDRFPKNANDARKVVLERARKKQIINDEYLRTALLSPLPDELGSIPKMTPHLAWDRRANGKLSGPTTINAHYQHILNNIARGTSLQPETNLAILLVNARTGAIVAYIGSQNYYDFQQLGAVDYIKAIRSPGSTLKPFIYAMAASEQLIHLGTIITDEATSIQGYQPKNISRTYHGDITVGEALQRSLNIPAVKVLHLLGPERFKVRLAQADILLREGEGLPIALGGAGINLYELVTLYTALANGGLVMPLTTQRVLSMENNHGKHLFAEEQIAQINYLLSQNTMGASRLHGRLKNQPIAYKTGTGPGGTDAWAIGANGEYVVGIWVGSPSGDRIVNNTGLTRAVPVMNQVFDILPSGRLIQQKPGKTPEALGLFKRRENQIKIRFPVDGSRIESRGRGIPIPLIIDSATYPVAAIVNNSSIYRLAAGNTNLNMDQPGSYELKLIDAKGKEASVNFVLQ